ncbi:type II toxin-antitoxin system prevent-host-death family antitoxin [Streptomyces kronopolitis]|uniref:type II toxin-antitoxin system prevent-host-death family antitoxin n=1 Tax=Streptomyces kronopolitis TaxID=1612435 RepID=UPI003D95B304
MTAAQTPKRAAQKPVLAPDGVQDLPLTDARAQLTTLIEDARERDLVTALTVRGRRRICLVTPEFYERAKQALGEG